MLSCVLVSGITGTVGRPLCVLLGRCADTGKLVLAARSTPLPSAQCAKLGRNSTEGDAEHPWRGVRFSSA